KTVNVFTPNLFSAVNLNPVRAWNINPVTGTVLNGPAEVFTPLANTAALAKNRSTPTDPNGSLYYMENTNFSNSGNVNLFAANPDGTGNTLIATADINGSNTAGLGFVRLGFDPLGNGWIVAGDFTTLYLARFVGNGISLTTITTVGTIAISGSGSANEFQNGDLAISGVGAMYIVANITGGETFVYVMNSLDGPTYTLTRRWKLVQPGGDNFTVSVNGVAFTQSGSLHVSSFQGLYFIDQTTANSSAGTVECVSVFALEGLTDLASDQFPLQSALPVSLISFSGNLRNNITTLHWEAENEISFSHYEIERKSSSSDFISIGSRSALNSSGRINYNYTDNLGNSTDKVFFYRLKMIDLDGKFRYSNTIMIKKENNDLTGLNISPNPIMNQSDVTVRFYAAVAGKVMMKLTDMAGRTVWQQFNNVLQGNNSLSLNSSSILKPGMYMLHLIEEHNISSTKLLVTQ
ncbi:MAG TPA: T9SS type A sorting domain-containing protein, partial [Chitinophagaceae bacterium]